MAKKIRRTSPASPLAIVVTTMFVLTLLAMVLSKVCEHFGMTRIAEVSSIAGSVIFVAMVALVASLVVGTIGWFIVEGISIGITGLKSKNK